MWDSGKKVVFVYDVLQDDEVSGLLESDPYEGNGRIGTRVVVVSIAVEILHGVVAARALSLGEIYHP